MNDHQKSNNASPRLMLGAHIILEMFLGYQSDPKWVSRKAEKIMESVAQSANSVIGGKNAMETVPADFPEISTYAESVQREPESTPGTTTKFAKRMLNVLDDSLKPEELALMRMIFWMGITDGVVLQLIKFLGMETQVLNYNEADVLFSFSLAILGKEETIEILRETESWKNWEQSPFASLHGEGKDVFRRFFRTVMARHFQVLNSNRRRAAKKAFLEYLSKNGIWIY